MFIGAQADVYEGMIIGEHSRDNDLEVNPLKGKKLTNIRASGTDEAVRLDHADHHVAGRAIAYIDDDELGRGGRRTRSACASASSIRTSASASPARQADTTPSRIKPRQAQMSGGVSSCIG